MILNGAETYIYFHYCNNCCFFHFYYRFEYLSYVGCYISFESKHENDFTNRKPLLP